MLNSWKLGFLQYFKGCDLCCLDVPPVWFLELFCIPQLQLLILSSWTILSCRNPWVNECLSEWMLLTRTRSFQGPQCLRPMGAFRSEAQKAGKDFFTACKCWVCTGNVHCSCIHRCLWLDNCSPTAVAKGASSFSCALRTFLLYLYVNNTPLPPAVHNKPASLFKSI